MKWLSRLKNIEIAPETDATKPTKPGFVGFVGFVASIRDCFDDRVTCTTCRNLAAGNNCLAYRRADLTTRALAADFANLKQRCGGFAALAQVMHLEADV